jgi:hypothetical protein
LCHTRLAAEEFRLQVSTTPSVSKSDAVLAKTGIQTGIPKITEHHGIANKKT